LSLSGGVWCLVWLFFVLVGSETTEMYREGVVGSVRYGKDGDNDDPDEDDLDDDDDDDDPDDRD